MNAINRLLATGEKAILKTGHQETFTVQTGIAQGSQLVGRLDVVPVIDAESGLGLDTRMQSVLRLLTPVVPIDYGDLISQGDTTWRIIKRENNDESITIDFWLEQQLPS